MVRWRAGAAAGHRDGVGLVCLCASALAQYGACYCVAWTLRRMIGRVGVHARKSAGVLLVWFGFCWWYTRAGTSGMGGAGASGMGLG
jgi:hypothetical protein